MTRPPITSLDLDVTDACPLRCDYCYKSGSKPRRLNLETGQAALDWLFWVSQDAKKVKVYFYGGEPLVEFGLIKKLVAYGQAEAQKQGKSIHFGGPSNLVLLTDEILDFLKQNQMSLGTSIDGGPESHDRYRKFPDGRGSSAIVAANAKKFLQYRPNTSARATVMPDNAHRLYEDAVFLLDLGYHNLAMIPMLETEWSEEQWEALTDGVHQVADLFIERYRQGKKIRVKYLNDAIQGMVKRTRRTSHCGAGRSGLAVTVEGEIFPCHRFCGYDKDDGKWCMGSVFGGYRDEMRDPFLYYHCPSHVIGDCDNCEAAASCGVSCVAVNWHEFRDIYRAHPNHCRMKRIFWREGHRVYDILYLERNPAFLELCRSFTKGHGKKNACSTPRP